MNECDYAVAVLLTYTIGHIYDQFTFIVFHFGKNEFKIAVLTY